MFYVSEELIHRRLKSLLMKYNIRGCKNAANNIVRQKMPKGVPPQITFQSKLINQNPVYNRIEDKQKNIQQIL